MSFFSRMGAAWSDAGRLVAVAVKASAVSVHANITFREVLLFGGAVLVGYGLSLVYLPAAFIVPGAMIGFVAIFGVK